MAPNGRVARRFRCRQNARLVKPIAALAERFLPNSRFVRHVAVLLGGTVGAQVIMIVAAPLLTRLYTPHDFGLLATYVALLAILSVIAALRYELAIPLPESDEEAAALLILSELVVLGMGAVSLVLVLFAREPIARALNTPALAAYLWLVPVGVVLAGTYQVLNNWAVRTKAFHTIARTKVTQAVGATGVQLAGHTFGPISLLLGHVASQAAGLTSLATEAWRNGPALKAVTFPAIVAQAKRHRRFPLYSTWSGFMNAASSQMPAFLLAALFTPAVAGMYMLTQRVLASPMTLIGTSVAQVFLSQAPQAHRDGTLPAVVTRIHGALSRIISPPIALIIVAGPHLFAFAFGAQWRTAGEFAAWLAVATYFQFLASPLSMISATLEKQSTSMMAIATLLLVRLGALYAAYVMDSAKLAIILFALVSAIWYFVYSVWCLSIAGVNGWAAFRGSAQAGALSLLACAPLLITERLFDGRYFAVSLGASLLLMGLLYLRWRKSM
jgi:O-antigen/teichoic acid export membrane protein